MELLLVHFLMLITKSTDEDDKDYYQADPPLQNIHLDPKSYLAQCDQQQATVCCKENNIKTRDFKSSTLHIKAGVKYESNSIEEATCLPCRGPHSEPIPFALSCWPPSQ
jgi:hypothetical protein